MIFALHAAKGGSLTEMQRDWSTMDLVLACAAAEIRDIVQSTPAQSQSQSPSASLPAPPLPGLPPGMLLQR